MIPGESIPLHPHQTSPILDRSTNEVVFTKDLQQIFGKEMADKLHKQGVVFRRIGTGELYFIVLDQRDESSDENGYLR